jgi:hypothetical protein
VIRPARRCLVGLLLLIAGLRAASADEGIVCEPPLPAVRLDLHGMLRGSPFWARLLPGDPRFGGHRVLQLVYDPPPAAAAAGIELCDCPFILVDQALGVLAWNGRDLGSSAVPAAPAGYRVTLLMRSGSGPDAKPVEVAWTRRSPVAWEASIVPVLLAFAWHAGGHGTAPVVELFAPPGAPERLSHVVWSADAHAAIACGPESWQPTPDGQGALASLQIQHGGRLVDVLTVHGR